MFHMERSAGVQTKAGERIDAWDKLAEICQRMLDYVEERKKHPFMRQFFPLPNTVIKIFGEQAFLDISFRDKIGKRPVILQLFCRFPRKDRVLRFFVAGHKKLGI